MTGIQKMLEGRTPVRLRPITAADGPLLIDIFAHMGPESRYLRFNEPPRAPEPARVQAEAQAIAGMPAARGRGWLALAQPADEEEIPVGAVRYVYSVDRRSAEFALSIRDDYQRRGLGTWFVEQAIIAARADGLETLFGYVQHSNEGMWRLLRRLSVEVETSIEDGDSVVTLFVRRRRETAAPQKSAGRR